MTIGYKFLALINFKHILICKTSTYNKISENSNYKKRIGTKARL